MYYTYYYHSCCMEYFDILCCYYASLVALGIDGKITIQCMTNISNKLEHVLLIYFVDLKILNKFREKMNPLQAHIYAAINPIYKYEIWKEVKSASKITGIKKI